MNLILLHPEDVDNKTGRARVSGRQFRHAVNVLGAVAGDELAVGVENGKVGKGRVVQVGPETIELAVTLDALPPSPLPVSVILALPRPKVLRRVLRSLSMLGVKRIWLVNSARVEKSYWQTPFLDPVHVREQLILGLEQARDTVVPDVQLRHLFKPFVEDELPDIVRGTVPMVAHPSSADPCPRTVERPVTLAVGPEGGFVSYEVERLKECGFLAVNLGERALSVEIAVPALLSRLF